MASRPAESRRRRLPLTNDERSSIMSTGLAGDPMLTQLACRAGDIPGLRVPLPWAIGLRILLYSALMAGAHIHTSGYPSGMEGES